MLARICLVAGLIALCLSSDAVCAEEPAAKPVFPGPTTEGFLLPNGWKLTPAGRQVPLTDLPLNIVTSADGKHAFVATSGYNAHELTAIEIATGAKASMQ